LNKLLPITLVLVVITFTTLQYAEGAVSWNGFLKQVGFDPPSVYEVSGVSVIPKGADRGNEILLPCSEGDWFLGGTPAFSFTTVPSIIGEGIRLSSIIQDFIKETDDPVFDHLSRIVAVRITPTYIDAGA